MAKSLLEVVSLCGKDSREALTKYVTLSQGQDLHSYMAGLSAEQAGEGCSFAAIIAEPLPYCLQGGELGEPT